MPTQPRPNEGRRARRQGLPGDAAMSERRAGASQKRGKYDERQDAAADAQPQAVFGGA